MKHIIGIGLGIVLLVGTAPALAASPAAARTTDRSPSVSARQVAAKVVVLRGRGPSAHGTVRLERRHAGHWKKVARATVRHHRYRVTVRQHARVVRYRAVAGGLASRSVVVRARVVRPASAAPSAVTSATPTSATSTTAPLGDACGPRVLKADGTPWACTFVDNFDGTSLDRTKWVAQTNFVSGTAAAHACYRDDPRNVSVGGGTLNLTVRRESTPIACENKSLGATSDYSAGSVMTYRLFSQKYGRFEARMKAPATSVPGLQEDFWLWPDDRDATSLIWPAAGEIDVAELYSQYPKLNIPYLHYTAWDNWGPVPGLNTSWTCSAPRGVYNTYTLDWTATEVRIGVNGKTCLVNKRGDIAFQRRYILAFSQMLGTAANALTANTPLPSTMNVDYVRVWS